MITNLQPPEVKKSLTGYSLIWKEGLTINVSNLKHKSDALKGEIVVKTTLQGYSPHLHQTVFNFTSTRAKAELEKELHKVCADIPWEIAIEQMRVKILQAFREQSQVEVIDASGQPPEFKYVIEPIALQGLPAIIFGSGGTGKSTFALYLAAIIQSGQSTKNLKISEPHKVLYLDWETNKDIIAYQYTKICKSIGNVLPLYYLKCSLTFTDSINTIKKHIDTVEADVLIIDSLGLACGGNLVDPDIANQFFLALAQLGTTTIILHHTSKSENDSKTPFGTVYFWNNSRNIFELRKIQEQGADDMVVGAFHRKANYNKLVPPMAFKIHHNETAISVEEVEAKDYFPDELSISERIYNLLITTGKMSAKEIAEALGIKQDVVRVNLNRMKAKGQTQKLGESWIVREPF